MSNAFWVTVPVYANKGGSLASSALTDFIAAWELFRDPLLCGLIAGGVLGFLSAYVVMRRMVFVSATLTQSAGLGVALAFYAQIHWQTAMDPLWAAALAALVATFALLFDPAPLGLSRDSVLGLVFAGSAGAAVIVGDRITQEAHHIQAILFGTAVLVRPLDLKTIALAGTVTLVLHLWWFRGVCFASFDGTVAKVQKVPVTMLQAFLLVSIGVMVGTSARALGTLPVFALSTLPAVAALALNLRIPWVFAVATVLGAAAGFGGYVAAFFLEFPVGACQTSVAAGFAVSAIFVRLLVRLIGRVRALRRA